MSHSNLFTEERITSIGPHEFRRDIHRLMRLLDFDVIDSDGAGDRGADLICTRGEEVWIIQSKYKKSPKGSCPDEALKQALDAHYEFNAHHTVIASSAPLSRKALLQLQQHKANGLQIGFWGLSDLRSYWEKVESPEPWELRCYQKEAVTQIQEDLATSNRALLFLATGLGKTVVAGEVIRNFFERNKEAKVLVLADRVELIQQLLSSLVAMLPKTVTAQLISGADKSSVLSGLTVATNQSILPLIDNGYAPDFVVIDECHHVGGENTYSDILRSLREDTPILGVTATPWRSDKYDIRKTFGPPSYECGIAEGMAQGYLAKVNYQLFCDNIDWDVIPQLSENEYTVKDLNRRLFIPQRDQQIIDRLIETWNETVHPRGVIFCQSIQHAEELHKQVSRMEIWRDAKILHSKLHRADRLSVLTDFRAGRCPLILAIDILNEGVDVPDVNIICFARVTHSRKIFMQQLGRGLRLAENKEFVSVLDFVADLRRLFETYKMQIDVDGAAEVVSYRSSIQFTDERAANLIDEWIEDAGDLSTAHDEYKLNFPESQLGISGK